MSSWIVEHADGEVTQHHEKPGTAGIEAGKRHAPTPRIGDLAVESWSWKRRRWEPVAEAAAERVDQLHAHEHGAHAIATARAVKAIEARLMLAGVAVDGLVAAEARATGQEPAVLARVIAAAAVAAEQHEIERIVAKRRLRGIQGSE